MGFVLLLDEGEIGGGMMDGSLLEMEGFWSFEMKFRVGFFFQGCQEAFLFRLRAMKFALSAVAEGIALKTASPHFLARGPLVAAVSPGAARFAAVGADRSDQKPRFL